MVETARTDVSSSQTVTRACQNQTIPEQKAACSSKCAQADSELLEQKVGSESFGTEEELGDPKVSGCLDEKLLEVTESKTTGFNTPQLRTYPNNSVECCLIRENLSSHRNDQETACKSECTHTHSELPEQKPNVGSEEGLGDCKLSGCVNEKLIQVTEYKTMDVDTHQLPDHTNNSVACSLIRENLSSQRNDQEAACGSECTHTHSELPEQKPNVESEEGLGDCKLSGCVDEKLIQVTEYKTMDVDTHQLPNHPNNSVACCLIGENISSQRNDQEIACESECTHTHSELPEQKPNVGSEEGLSDCKLSDCVNEKLILVTEYKTMDVDAHQLPNHPNNSVECCLIRENLSSQRSDQETTCESECAHAYSELPEQKPNVGSEEGLGDCKLSGCVDEKLIQVTEYKTVDVNTQQLPNHPNNSVECCLIRENLSSQQNDQETACESECTHKHSDLPEKNANFGSEEGLGDCKFSGFIDEKLIQVTEYKTMNVNTQQLPTHPKNVVESCLINEDLSSQQNVPQLESEVVSACMSGDHLENAFGLAENVEDPPIEAFVVVARVENDSQPSSERGTHSSSHQKLLPIDEDVPQTTISELAVQDPPLEASVQVPRVEDESQQSPERGTCSSNNWKLLPTDEDVLENISSGQLFCMNQSVMHSLEDKVNCGSSEPLAFGNEQSVSPSENAPKYNSSQQLCSSKEHHVIHPEDAACSNMEYPMPHSEDDTKKSMPSSNYVATNSSIERLGAPSSIANQSRYGRRSKTTAKQSKRKYMLRSLGGSDRLLRSRNREKTKKPESNTNTASVNKEGHKKRRKRKKGRGEEVIDDEYEKIRKRLKYWLHRISYEQSFIDAYSGEGWKGQSVEKLKPEKELQRAASEILRHKLKIRDLFQHLDLLCAEGRFEQSLFDSEGQIDSEDIFCAKCGSEDLSSDNDIILCDGACDRGFHQFCLEPPLLSENIPAGDEGWLCPGCDCKDDCLELMNEFQGTNLDITNSWERIFPEAAAMAAGRNVDPNFGLPSDESDDGDYNPNALEDEDTLGGSSSDDTEYASAPEEIEASGNQDPYLGLPSEDSEDDDYNPIAPGIGKKDTEEFSSSDFTSDSEDLAAVIEANKTSALDDNASSGSLKEVTPSESSGRRKSKVGGKPQSLDDELLSLLEADPGQDGCAIISGRRYVERLNYKKLYDEAYSNVEHESSDDEDWTDTAPRRMAKCNEIVVALSHNGKAPTSVHKSKESLNKPTIGTNTKSNFDNVNCSPAKPNEGSSISCSSGNRTSSSYRRLGETAIQSLYASFRENQYPDRATKDSLAKELGLKFQQVSKWFENYRWSFRHYGKAPAQLPTGSTPSNGEAGMDRTMPDRCLVESKNGHFSQDCNKDRSSCPSSRKRKRASDSLPSDANRDVGESPSKPLAKSAEVNKVKKTGRSMKRRKN